METILAVAASALLLVMVAWGVPGHNLLPVLAVALALIVAIVAAEQNGWWPRGWRTR